MPTGKIKTLLKSGFGFIQPDDGSKDVHFQSHGHYKDTQFDELVEGQLSHFVYDYSKSKRDLLQLMLKLKRVAQQKVDISEIIGKRRRTPCYCSRTFRT